MDTQSQNSSLEISLNGKRYEVSLEPLLQEVREELIALIKECNSINNEVNALVLFKAYITKAQDYAKLCQSLESLYQSLEGSVPNSQPVQIHSIESH